MVIENLFEKKLILALLIFNYPFYWLYIVSQKKGLSLQVIPQLGKRQKERARRGGGRRLVHQSNGSPPIRCESGGSN
jgi:hypothetical protein